MNKERSSSAQAASEKFAAGYRCAEAILTVYGERVGLAPGQAMKLGCAFGGGLGSCGDVCGAVTAVIMILGLKYGRTDKDDAGKRTATDAKVREFLIRFRAAHGHLRCNDLVGFDRSTPEGHEKAAAAGVFKRICPELVMDASLILEDLLRAETV